MVGVDDFWLEGLDSLGGFFRGHRVGKVHRDDGDVDWFASGE